MLVEKSVFRFEAKLKYLNKDDYFMAEFNVLAKNGYEAKAFLRQWLSYPEQTGYKFEECLGIISKPSIIVLVEE